MKKIIVAHRGGMEFFHENTIKAFNKAIELDVPYLEYDVRQTKDKQLICFHDADIKEQKVVDLTYDELQKLTDFDVPTFEDTLKATKGKIKHLCDIKADGYEKEVIALLKKYLKHTDDYIVIASKDSILIKIKIIDTKINKALIIGTKGFFKEQYDFISGLFRAKRYGCNFFMPNHKFLTFKIHRFAKFFKLKVFTWTVNDQSLIKKYLEDKDIYGIITDKPKKGLELLAASSNRS